MRNDSSASRRPQFPQGFVKNGPALLFAVLMLAVPAQATSFSGDDPPRLFNVEVSGTGPAMILIPGLASGGQVWEDGVAAYYRKSFTCHVITLAGFAGTPAVKEADLLQAVRDELIAYIKAEGLDKPVMVGHSMGGFLALWVGATAPDLVGPLVIIDSLPYLPAAMAPEATPETIKPQADAMLAMMAGVTQEQFHQQQAATLPMMITDPADVERVLASTSQSDPQTVAQAMYELFMVDLREDLARIKVPALVIGTWLGYKPYATKDQIAQSFEAQYAGLPEKRILISDTAKHFVMYDDLDGLLTEMNAFLK